MTEAILLEQAERGGPSGPGTSVRAAGMPAQQGLGLGRPQPQTFESIPELSTLGIGTGATAPGQPQGFEGRFQQGLGIGPMTGAGMGALPGAGMAGMGTLTRPGMGALPGTGMGALPGAGMGALPGAGMGALSGAGMGALPGTGMGAIPGAGMGALPGAGMGTIPGAGMGALSGTGMPSMTGMTGLGFPQTAGAMGGMPFSTPGFGAPGSPGTGFPSMPQPGLTSGMIDPITGQSVALNPSGAVDGGARSNVMHAHAQTVGRMQGGGASGQRAFPGEINQNLRGANTPRTEMSSPAVRDGRVSNILEDESGFFYLFYPRPESVDIRVNITKEGYCRREVPIRDNTNCMNGCYSDNQCPHELKCCPSGCSLRCVRPQLTS